MSARYQRPFYQEDEEVLTEDCAPDDASPLLVASDSNDDSDDSREATR